MADELISRQTAKLAVMRAGCIGNILPLLDAEPAVDAVEVVRCKDCRQWQRHTQINRDYGGCRRYGSTMFFGDFCSYGKRREENAAD